MKKDTQEAEPVESIEASVSAALDAAEEIDDEKEQPVEQPEDAEAKPEAESTDSEGDSEGAESGQEQSELSGDESDSGSDDTEAGEDEEEDLGGSDDDLAASPTEESDKLTAPEHWSAADRETFTEQPPEAQEWMLKRHKELEGDYTRKRQQESSQVRLAESVTDALAPYKQEFDAAGMDEAAAVRRLASVHQALKTDGKSAILNLAQTYGIDLSEEDQEFTDPALRQTQSQLSNIEQRIARQEQAAQHEKQEALLGTIKTFEEATDGSGKLLHPHFKTLQDDITALFNAGLAKDLGEGYSKAMSMRPDLAVVKAVPKVNQAQKVAKAKKAATGIKSSGAVGKTAKVMSLEEEIASQIP